MNISVCVCALNHTAFVVLDDEISSVIAYTLSSTEYKTKFTQLADSSSSEVHVYEFVCGVCVVVWWCLFCVCRYFYYYYYCSIIVVVVVMVVCSLTSCCFVFAIAVGLGCVFVVANVCIYVRQRI